jgi:uncharacterized protein (DUF983 family)
MALQILEAPGGAGLQVLCPYCSRMHDKNDYPPKCRRCGSDMDMKAAKAHDMSSVPAQS